MTVLVFMVSALACARPDEPRATAGRKSAAPLASVVPASDEIHQALAALRREETERRARTDFAALPPSSRSLGSNPYALAELGGSPRRARFAGVLRGESALVLLDREGVELSRSDTVQSANSLAVLPDGRVFVAGDIEPRVARHRIEGSRIVSAGDVAIPEAGSLRAVAADANALFVADFWRDRLYATSLERDEGATGMSSAPLCGGPIRLALTRRFLGALCLFDHAVVVFARDAGGLVTREVARVVHDGPIWGFSLAEQGDRLFVAAGGVEDHPLDRRDKAFGYVDSFVTLYRLDGERRPERLFALNTAELGVVTPKVARLDVSATALRLTVIGYASDAWLELELGPNGDGSPRIHAKRAGIPGCSDVGFAGDTLLCANPLFDAWIAVSTSERHAPRPRGNQPSAASPTERLGEALFFTTLMAPDATSEGRRSRFTCETCHFEGGTDGRVHHSGRDDIRVSTRPLLGLFNDAPHFSRAHDPDLTSVSHNEFTVANRGNPIDPWFSLTRKRFPWLSELGVTDEVTPPLALRRALLAFLARFSHAENPLAVRRPLPRRFTDDERRGAELFRAHCVRCHAARLVARDAAKDVPFERWEALVLSPEGPIVWSNGDYAKTGVLPYVDPKGTQTPSLRRLYLKRPYLTNGSSRTLGELLAEVRWSESEFAHARASAAQRELAPDERRALLAFLELL
jgi:hypothetical protein